MDVRMISLYKLHIPKTKAFEQLVGSANVDTKGHKYYFTMGSYDLIDVTKVDINKAGSKTDSKHLLNKIHSFAESSKGSDSIISEEAFSVQRLYAFANSNGCEDEDKKIENFWQDKLDRDSHLFFVSMLHINDYADNGLDLDEILECIDTCYREKNVDYLCYFTLDYSDIVIFCKSKTVSDYISAINKLNYGNPNKKVVRDSFSIYGICRRHMLEQFDWIRKLTGNSFSDEEKQKIIKEFVAKEPSEFCVKINISVQNYQTLKYFRNQLTRLLGMDADEMEINQLGRHDFSIINNNATLYWLILVEYLIDECTTVKYIENEKVNPLNGTRAESDVFLTFEAFVGNVADEYDDVRMEYRSGIDTEPLNKLCKSFQDTLTLHYKNAGNYYIPVNEVENSIRSITRNRFAEDFVICMYESFYRFVDYMRSKITADKSPCKKIYLLDEEFDRTFNSYFHGLIALANSGMHADRSFIQATAFNAVFYDVPPKLMSFYTAIVYRLIDIIRDVDLYNYAFLFVPNFSNDIIVETISYKQINPEHRLFLVSINEVFFYNPTGVIQTMAHETAHFAGDSKRMRSERIQRYIKCIVYGVLRNTLPDTIPLDDGLNKTINLIAEEVYKQLNPNGKALYVGYFDQLINAVCQMMRVSKIINEYVKTYIENEERAQHIDSGLVNYPVDNKIRYVYERYRLNLKDIIKGSTTEGRAFIKTLQNVKSVFVETYADLQMIVLLNLSFKDYVDKFIENEKLVIDKLLKDTNIKRIAIITKLMTSIGVWDGISEFRHTDAEDNDIVNFWIKLKDNVRQIGMFTDNNDDNRRVIGSLKATYTDFHRQITGEEICFSSNKTEKYIQAEYRGAQSNLQIYLYLRDTLKAILDEYIDNGKIEKIKKLRNMYDDIKNFDDIYKVYRLIRTEIEYYKQTMSKRLQEPDSTM